MVHLENSNLTNGDLVKSSKLEKNRLTSSPSPEATQDEKEEKVKGISKKWILIGLCVSNFWSGACMSLQAPFFPQEAESKGASATVYGFIFGVFEIATFAASPVFAKIMPRVAPKFLSIAGALLVGVSCSLFGLLDFLPAGNIYIGMAFAVRILEGVGSAAIMTASFTICSAEFLDAIATSISFLETALGLGLIVGPTIGGALFQAGGFMLPFLVCGVSLIVTGIALGFILPSTEKVGPQPPRDFKKFFFHFDIFINTFSILTALFYIGFNSATLEPHIRKFNLKPAIVGLIFVISGGIYALTTPLWGRLLDKGADADMLCAFGYVLVSTSLLFLGPVPFIPIETQLWLVIVSLVFSGFGVAVKILSSFIGARQNTCARGFADDVATNSMISALYGSACSAGAFFGPTLGGFLLDTVGYENGTVIVLGIELFFLALMMIHICDKCRKKRMKDSERLPLITKSAYEKNQLSNS